MNPRIDKFGNKEWYRSGYRHRDNGPAILHKNGNQFWYQHGKLHRLDGPAVILWQNERQEWWVQGKYCISQTEFQVRSGLFDEEMTLLILKYGEIR